MLRGINLSKKRRFTYRVIFLRKDNNMNYEFKIQDFRDIPEFLLDKEKNKAYHIPIQNPLYLTQKSVFVYFVDIDSNQVYSFEKSKEFLNAKQMGIALKTSIVKDALSGISRENQKIDWFSFITGILIGGLAIGLLVFLIMQNKLDSMLNLINQNNPIYPPF